MPSEVDFRKEKLKFYINGIKYHSIHLKFYGKENQQFEDTTTDQWHFTISLNARDIEISIYDQFPKEFQL